MNLGIFLASLSGALYGSLGLFGVLLIQEGFGITNFLFWRFLFSVILMLPFLNTKQSWRDVTSKPGLVITIVSGIFYATATSSYFYAVDFIGSGLAMVLFFCYPIFVVLLDWLHGKNPPSKITVIGLLVVMIGTFCLSDPHQWSASFHGLAWGLLCAFSFGIYFYTSQLAIKSISVVSGTFCICLGNCLIFAILFLWNGVFQVPTTISALTNISALAVLATLLPIYFVFVALRYIDSTKASILSVLEPIVTIILGVMFLNEKITLLQYCGVGIVLVGVYLVQSCKKQQHKKLVVDANLVEIKKAV